MSGPTPERDTTNGVAVANLVIEKIDPFSTGNSVLENDNQELAGSLKRFWDIESLGTKEQCEPLEADFPREKYISMKTKNAIKFVYLGSLITHRSQMVTFRALSDYASSKRALRKTSHYSMSTTTSLRNKRKQESSNQHPKSKIAVTSCHIMA